MSVRDMVYFCTSAFFFTYKRILYAKSLGVLMVI